MKAGDWLCPNCNSHNYASRTSCYKCRLPFFEYEGGRYSTSSENMGRIVNTQFGEYSRGNYPVTRSCYYRAGDWICPKPTCKFENFASRVECKRCGFRRMAGGPGHTGAATSGMSKPAMGSTLQTQGGGASALVLHGDWICSNCGYDNYAVRTRCGQCGSPAARISRTTDRTGDWTCPNENCRYHNYASRDECYRCGTRKAPAMGTSSMFPGYNSSSANVGGNGGGEGEAPSEYVRGSDASHGMQYKMKPGDWMCMVAGCGFPNFARRGICAQCGAPATDAATEGPPGVPPESVKNTFPALINCGKHPSQQHAP